MWTTVSVRREVREALEGVMREQGLSSPNDAVVFLLRKYRECEELRGLLAGVLERLGRVEEVLAALERRLGVAPATQPKASRRSGTSGGGRRSARDILREEGVSCVGELRGVKDPKAVVEKLIREGAYAVSVEGDRCAVAPEAVEELLERLSAIKSSEPRVVEVQLGSGRLVKVFRVLYSTGALYYDKGKGWVLLEDVLEGRGG